MFVADVVRKTERRINALAAKHSKNAGWEPGIIGSTGYGNAEYVRVFGRVLLEDSAKKRDEERNKRRGFWQFFTVEFADFPVTITTSNRTVETTMDSNGYIEVLVRNHGLKPGQHEITINDTPVEVLTVSPETKYDIVSDIDGTVLVTMLPRALIAAYNSWVKETDERKAVAGFSEFYAQLRHRYVSKTSEDTDVLVIYLSTGAWNTFGTLEEFLYRSKLPEGPLLLTDWGLTPTGLFRSDKEHKKVRLRDLFTDFPKINWIPVGDDGQYDPPIYGTAAAEHPDEVATIAIRNLTPSKHVLFHGTAVPIEKLENEEVPFIEGTDGFELLKQLDQLPQP